MIAPTRRSLLVALAGAGVVTATGMPVRMAFAAGTGERRLVLVLLRGGLDGLHAVPAHGDPAYRSARGGLALSAPGGEGKPIALDGTFALHPALAPLMPLWQARELAVIHAVGLGGYTGRSHFDAQNILETGAALARSRDDGWLNRAIAEMSSAPQPAGLAVGQGVPLVLQGPEKVSSWAPSVLPAADEDYLARVARLYERDPQLKSALKAALDIRMVADVDMAGEGRRARASFPVLVKGMAALMTAPTGPRLAVVDVGGWDSHTNQGMETGQIANRLAELAKGLVTLKAEFKDLWSETAVLVVTEFGRTVAMNGSKGTDHGTGGAAFALGGTVVGGKVHGDWPGLGKGQLFEGRDLKVTTHVNALFKAALIDHLGLSKSAVDTSILGGTGAPAAMQGLFS